MDNADMTETPLGNEIDRLKAENERLREAATALVERWDTPSWKHAEHTGKYITRLRTALSGKGDWTYKDVGDVNGDWRIYFGDSSYVRLSEGAAIAVVKAHNASLAAAQRNEKLWLLSAVSFP